MHNFSVWAPKAQGMELQLEDRRLPMRQGERGWWSADAPEGGPGANYGFWLNGEGPFPDPCSPWQPEGVHGLSRRVDHSLFPWTDENFQARPLASGVLYELHIGAFTPEGTFDSAIRRLDDLRALGITHIELMPVAEFAGEYGWGYDGVDLYAPHHGYGGPGGDSPTALKRLVDACHARGMGVILDVVYNHLGAAGNYLDRFGPYHSKRHNTAWGQAMNFDGPGSDEVRRFFIDNARLWLVDYHFDGLRLDAVHAILDNSALHFLEELERRVEEWAVETGRRLILIAESDLNDPRVVQPPELGGYGLEAQWSDDFHHALHVLLTGETSGYYADYTHPWQDLAKALRDVFIYDGCYSRLRARRHGRPVGALPGSCFVGYIQNHDQIGNRARGERIGQLVGPRLAQVAAALVMTAPFVPMLFMGEEWGASTPFQYFTDHEEELGKAVSEGRKAEFALFGWQPEEVPDPQEYETFQRSKLDWAEREREPHAGLLEWHRQLIALRRHRPALLDGQRGAVQVRYDDQSGWLTLRRGPVLVACSLAAVGQVVPIPAGGDPRLLLASDPQASLVPGGVFLPGQSVAILEVTGGD